MCFVKDHPLIHEELIDGVRVEYEDSQILKERTANLHVNTNIFLQIILNIYSENAIQKIPILTFR